MKFQLFHPDSPLVSFLNRIGRLIILNFLFLLTCIPIITIGASISALYTVTLKQARNDEPYIAQKYFEAFKINFKQSTLLWLLWMLIFALLGIDFQVMRQQTSTIASIMRVALYIVILIADMTWSYTFPLQASFYNSIKQTIQNAFLLSIRHFNKTIPVLIIPIAAVCVTLLSVRTLYFGILLWIFLGFATVAQLRSHYLVQVIDYYINPPEEEDWEEEEWGEDGDIPAEETDAPVEEMITPAEETDTPVEETDKE